MFDIENLYIVNKSTGDTLSATEFNKVPDKINEIIDWLSGFDERTRQLIAQSISPCIKVMTTAEYLALGTWDTGILYACVDNGVLTSANLGQFTIYGSSGLNGLPYNLPIIL